MVIPYFKLLFELVFPDMRYFQELEIFLIFGISFQKFFDRTKGLRIWRRSITIQRRQIFYMVFEGKMLKGWHLVGFEVMTFQTKVEFSSAKTMLPNPSFSGSIFSVHIDGISAYDSTLNASSLKLEVVSAEIRTRDIRMRSTHATSVLSRPLITCRV